MMDALFMAAWLNADFSPRIELKTQESQWNATATFQKDRAYFNELAWNGDAQDWHFSIGKKIVSWDVGYAFRPNDMVQQENRRALYTTTLEGRNVAMAEHFGNDSAWSIVGTNSSANVNESALNLRYYQRSGALDWYAFARSGERTGASIGTAAAWVVDEAVELHGSIRSDEWLLGGTWTNESQISVLAEVWRSNEWKDNRFIRLSWDGAEWKTALDMLYIPQIQSQTTTASVTWKGERTQIQGGLRVGNYVERQAFLVVTFTP